MKNKGLNRLNVALVEKKRYGKTYRIITAGSGKG